MLFVFIISFFQTDGGLDGWEKIDLAEKSELLSLVTRIVHVIFKILSHFLSYILPFRNVNSLCEV